MKQKIVQLMKSEGLSSSRLAEILEIQPSGVSHLVSGRNKPSFELLQKILRRFPNINPYWLILDDKNMYRHEEALSGADEIMDLPPRPLDPFASTELFQSITQEITPQSPLDEVSMESSKIDKKESKMVQMVILYDDGTCQSYMCR